MSKELTEKYYDGTLSTGYYYFNNSKESQPGFFLQGEHCSNNITVLERVPTYKKYKKLKKRLADAEEVIKWYNGLEDILIGWEICTGQQKGTAKKYLDKWGVK